MSSESIARLVYGTTAVIAPWMCAAAAVFACLSVLSSNARKGLFAGPAALFNALPPWKRFVVLGFFVSFAFVVVPKNDGGLRGGAAPSPRSMPPEMAEEANLLSVTDFAVDASNGAVAFEVAWTNNLFDWTDSRNLFLFSTTNLMEGRWTPLGAFPMPEDVTSHAFMVTSNDVDSASRPWFADSLGGIGFYRFGIDIDSDGDGLADAYERLVSRTDPALADTDGDGLGDG